MQPSRFFILVSVIVSLQLVYLDAAAVRTRTKRAAYQLPDGIEFYVGDIKTTFECPGDGYYGDIDNDCKLFHICITHTFPKGDTNQEQYTFACGNQTVFNQFSLTCSHEDEAVPCNQSPDFYYLNELLYAGPEAVLHTDQDVERAALYGTRLSSSSNAKLQKTSPNRETESSDTPAEAEKLRK